MRICSPQGFLDDFPRLDKSTRPASPPTKIYNCIAWALGVTDRWWWPGRLDAYWLPGCPEQPSIPAFKALFAIFRYKPCADGRLESGYEKLALYAKGNEPTHAARQLRNGRWTSKCGANVDIEHKVKDLEGPKYGKVIMYFRRLLQEQ